MTEQQPTPTDDVEGHGIRVRFADAERDETDDTEGHVARSGRGSLAGGLQPPGCIAKCRALRHCRRVRKQRVAPRTQS